MRRNGCGARWAAVIVVALVVSLAGCSGDDTAGEPASAGADETVEQNTTTSGSPAASAATTSPSSSTSPVTEAGDQPTITDDGSPDNDGASAYAPSGWATVHADSGNRKYVPVTPAESYMSAWRALEDASVLAAPTIGPDGTIYATTGQGPGNSTLHAYSPDGEVLWETEPWEDASDFDSCAILQGPVIDADGNVYASDCNQFWVFNQDGTVKWTVDLPEPSEGTPWQGADRAVPFRPFVTVVLTTDGAVLGITVWNQVVVLDRETGELEAPVFQLPATEAPPANSSMTKPPTLFADGFADPELIDPVWELFWGGTMPQANTPVISTGTGRVFAVAATTEAGGKGALYGIDYTPGSGEGDGSIDIAFEAVVGKGSSSSPTLSADNQLVYVTDEDGVFYAVDTEDGSVVCESDAGSNGGSPTAGPDGRVYLLGDQGAGLNAYDADCEKVWDAGLDEVAAELPGDTELGAPQWRVGGPPTITDDGLLAPLSIGYEVPIAGNTPFVAVAYYMVSIDSETGRVDRILAPESGESDGFTVPNLINDTIVVDYGVVASSSLAPLAGMVNELLPPNHQMPEVEGGIELFIPEQEPQS